MLRKLAIAFAATVVLGAAPGATDAASAATFGGFGRGGVSHGLGHRSGIMDRSGAAGRVGGGGARLGAGYAGMNHRYGAGGHEGSGWYYRGWGGTMSPGWGYGFGPNLGGSGH